MWTRCVGREGFDGAIRHILSSVALPHVAHWRQGGKGRDDPFGPWLKTIPPRDAATVS